MTGVDAGGAEIRPIEARELDLLGQLDRSEQIAALYVQQGAHLVLREGGNWSATRWTEEGDGEHSVAQHRAYCEQQLAAGGSALGAFDGDRLVGIGVMRPEIRPGVAQLAFLHVSNGYRATGIGGRLARDLERVARDVGARSMVVSATPSVNTVDFYRRLGFEPMAEPLPELFELEPEDIHMHKTL